MNNLQWYAKHSHNYTVISSHFAWNNNSARNCLMEEISHGVVQIRTDYGISLSDESPEYIVLKRGDHMQQMQMIAWETLRKLGT
jgi:hypothetical protein